MKVKVTMNIQTKIAMWEASRLNPADEDLALCYKCDLCKETFWAIDPIKSDYSQRAYFCDIDHKERWEQETDLEQ